MCEFNKQNDSEVKEVMVMDILTNKLKMSYNKIIKVSPHANSTLNIIMRQ